MREHLHHDMDWITGDRVHHAFVLMEGFDHLTAAQLTAKGWNSSANSMQPGRFDGQCARNNGSVREKALPATYTTLFGGFAYRASSIPGAATDFFIVRTAIGGTNILRIGVDASNKISIRNSGGTVVAAGTTTLNANTWYYVEFKLVIAGAAGSIEIHLNGASGEIATTTGNFGSTAAASIALNAASGLGNSDYDDIYVLDTTGAAPRNTFLGDFRVKTIWPSADGAHSQWTPSVAGTHFDKVNETTPDDDTTYVSDATVGHLDTYAFGDVDGGATVFGVQVNIYARKDDAATRQIAPVIRQGGTDSVGSTFTLGASYSVISEIHQQDPAGSDWTAANVNADEFGVEAIA